MTLRGSTTEFPLDILLRLFADTKKTGELTLRGQKGEGALGLAEGRVVTAMYADEKPIPALGFILELGEAEFEFTPWNDAPPANLEGSLDDNRKRADEYAKWRADVRSVIPHDGIRFRLSERAADQGAVTFTSDRWRVVMAVNTRPSVNELAANLHIDRDDALTTLAGLVRDGVIETIDEPAPPQAAAPAPGPPRAAEMSAPAAPVETAPAAEETPPAQEYPAEDWSAALLREAAEPEPAEAPPPPQSAPEDRTQQAQPSSDAWAEIPAPPSPPPSDAAPAPTPDWMSAPSAPAPEWSPAPMAPPASDWAGVPTPPPGPEAPPQTPAPSDWTASPPSEPSQEWTSSSQAWTPAPPAPADWSTPSSAPSSGSFAPEPTPFAPRAPETFTPAESARADAAPPAQDWSRADAAPPAQDWAPAQPAEPAPMDDRLAALQGLFNQPQSAPTGGATDTWVTPGAPPKAPAADPRIAAMDTTPSTPAAGTPNEWSPPPAVGAPAQQKKGGGLFGGLFGRKSAASTEASNAAGNGGAGSRAGKLAAFSNALLSEYTSGGYGKGKVDDRMPSLLMRVDEQADPIDRPLPVVDDRLDVQALERVQIAENQAVPYLATLVSTIYGDAEKAFGKDRAKRGYKNAQQQTFGADMSALSGPDVAGKLPKI